MPETAGWGRLPTCRLMTRTGICTPTTPGNLPSAAWTRRSPDLTRNIRTGRGSPTSSTTAAAGRRTMSVSSGPRPGRIGMTRGGARSCCTFSVPRHPRRRRPGRGSQRRSTSCGGREPRRISGAILSRTCRGTRRTVLPTATAWRRNPRRAMTDSRLPAHRFWTADSSYTTLPMSSREASRSASR